MAVVIETTLGDLTVDLFLKERPQACLNFLKLCKLKYYNYNLFHTIQEGFIAQTGGKYSIDFITIISNGITMLLLILQIQQAKEMVVNPYGD